MALIFGVYDEMKCRKMGREKERANTKGMTKSLLGAHEVFQRKLPFFVLFFFCMCVYVYEFKQHCFIHCLSIILFCLLSLTYSKCSWVWWFFSFSFNISTSRWNTACLNYHLVRLPTRAIFLLLNAEQCWWTLIINNRGKKRIRVRLT